MNTYEQAINDLGIKNPFNNYQVQTFLSTTSQGERQYQKHPLFPLKKSIEVAISLGKDFNQFTIEDLCSFTRVGLRQVYKAQKAADSYEFKDYITAKNNNGDFIIPPEEQLFLKTWISNIDID